MAIKRRNQMEWALGTTNLALTAEANESIRVRGIYSAGATGTHLTVTVGQRTVGYFRCAGSMGNHIPFPPGFSTVGPVTGVNLFDMAYEKGWHRGFPIGAGQTLNFSGINDAGSVQAVLYDIYDMADIKPSDPNGSESNELDYVAYGNTGATITAATDSLYDTLVNPTEFLAFPYGTVLVGLNSLTLFAVMASTFAPSANDATNDMATTYLKFTRNQTVLFDKDTTGLLLWQAVGTQSADQVGAGASIIGNFSSTDQRLPLVFDEPMVFAAGDELSIEVTTQIAGTGADYLIADQEIGLFFRQVRS